MSQSIVDIQIIDASNYESIDVSHLKNPISITFQIKNQSLINECKCAYRENKEDLWETDGLSNYIQSNGLVQCKAYHLT